MDGISGTHRNLATQTLLPAAGIGLAASAVGGLAFRGLHQFALKLPAEALARATPGPFLAFGAIGAGVALADRSDLQLWNGPHAQLTQDALLGAVIFGAMTLASPSFHGTKQPLAISLLVNAGLGAAVGAAVHGLTKPD